MAPTTKTVKKTKKSREKLAGVKKRCPITPQEADELGSYINTDDRGAFVNMNPTSPDGVEGLPESILGAEWRLKEVTTTYDGGTTITWINDKGEERCVATPPQPLNSYTDNTASLAAQIVQYESQLNNSHDSDSQTAYQDDNNMVWVPKTPLKRKKMKRLV